MTARLLAEDVVYRRGGRAVLDGVSLSIEAGEMVAVAGPSGSGKSSLLAVLGGLEPPDGGTVSLDGLPLRPGDPGQRRRFGLVLQGYGLLTLLTAAENVEIALQARGVFGQEARLLAGDALAELGIAGVSGKLVEKLSGGQQQRVAIARALVTTPDVVLADEPTAELDHASQSVVIDALRAAADRGAAVVIATHDPDVAAECDRALRFHEGRLAG
ncbi:MAG: putative transport system ATP-binding protein [Frankiaceae bacterium]|nr:putative transport system ATP-binding protein [Frankiaceae bacterium]